MTRVGVGVGVRRAGLAGLIVLLALLGARPAGATPTVTVSDRNVAPGQVITVHGSGLRPGAPFLIDFFGDAVRLGQGTVGDDGAFSAQVQIPSGTTDGPKGLQVTSIDVDGRYASVPIDLVVAGPPATARLSTTSVRPGQRLTVSGTRFRPGEPVYLVLFPEEVLLGEPVAGADGTFAADVRLPDDLLNGKHGIVVAGVGGGGSFAYVILEAQASGGTGFVPDGYTVPRSHPLAGGAPSLGSAGPGGGTTSSTSTSTSTASSTTRPAADGVATDRSQGGRAGVAPSAGSDGAVILLLLAAMAALLVLAVVWLRSSDGRRWSRRRWEGLGRRLRWRRRALHR